MGIEHCFRSDKYFLWVTPTRFPKLLLREVFVFPQFPEPKPEIEYLSTSHIHAPHGLYYMG